MNRSNVEEIKSRLSVEELIGSYVKLEKAGKSFKARCPFHNEKTASFFISPERGGYYCFGCGAKGDIFSFVEQFEGLDFRGALKVLAERTGVKLVHDDKADSEHDRLFKIVEEAAKYFEHQYAKSEEASKYLKSRGISEQNRQAFRIGWAPLRWKNLHSHLRAKGWTDDVMEKAGLIKKGDKGDYYDRFRGRIIFPITDSSGRVVAFTGRILVDDGKSAKYLNSPESPLFSKSQILFGLDKAKSEIRRLDYSILVEGQMDLVLSHQVGVKNTVAAFGTALTDQSHDQGGIVSNLGMVRRLSPNMIIALDADKAGRTAAMRAVAATALSLGMSVKITDIEGGKDPADLIIKDPESWKKALRGAKHVVEFELENVIKETSDIHRLAKSVRERVFPFLARIGSEMDKAFYVKCISERTNLSETAVWEDLRKFEREKLAELNPKQNLNKNNINNKQVSHNEKDSLRLNLVERRMFGLLHLMENSGHKEAVKYREEIKKIASDSYEDRAKRTQSIISDLSFEAEAFFGNQMDKWDVHMKELILNFEEDLINEKLMNTMSLLRIAESQKDSSKVAELATKCQNLSVRRAEISKRRRN